MTTTPLTLANPHWLQPIDFPFRTRRLAIEGHELSFVDEGSGSPLLFVHGTPSWSFEWRHAIRALRDRHRCVAPDHLGFGLSAKPTGGTYWPADHARRLRELVVRLDLRDVTLVVHDFGGPIGLPLALNEPDRIRSVVVVNSWMWPLGDDPTAARIARFVRSPLGRLFYLWLDGSPRWLLPATFADRSQLSAETHRAYRAPFRSRHERRGPWTLGRALGECDDYYGTLWERRAVLGAKPLQLVWGMADPTFDEVHLDRWREAFPRAAVTRLPGVGHFPQEEAPDELTATVAAAARR